MGIVEYYEAVKADGARHNPALAFLGAEIEELKPDSAVLSMDVRPEFLQGSGFMQGGLISALADEAIAHAVMGHIVARDPEKDTFTVEIKTSFLNPVQSGRLTARAFFVKTGRKVIFAEAVVTNDQGRDVAKSSATFMLVPRQ
jgi:uncharacterized protein (TIGR00369 family)